VSAWSGIARHIGEATGTPFDPSGQREVGGGCISATSILSDGERAFFVKRNDPSRLDLFEAEADGLAALQRAGALRVPEPICWGSDQTGSYLVLERLDLSRGGGGDSGAETGRRLAELHRWGLAEGTAFGWHRDNYIGATHQPNGQGDDWVAFWRDRRLGFQLDLAARNGHGRGLQVPGDRLLAGLEALIDHRPQPSLLHGDLWGGNLGYLRDGTPVIYDPAVYRGDREADLAMTELFGGFGGDFYAAYREAWPLDPGYPTRKTLYNLYHVLNHLNLFGTGYLGQAKSMMERLLAEIG
jgi:fructosamine-3-kinase